MASRGLNINGIAKGEESEDDEKDEYKTKCGFCRKKFEIGILNFQPLMCKVRI